MLWANFLARVNCSSTSQYFGVIVAGRPRTLVVNSLFNYQSGPRQDESAQVSGPMRQKCFLLDISNIHTFLHSQYIARKHTSRDVMVSTAFLTSVHIPCKNFSSSSNFGKHHDGCVLSSNCICLSSSSTMALTRLSYSRRTSTLARALINLRSQYER